MTSNQDARTPTDRVIDALRANSDELTANVQGLSDDQLTTPSGASEWTVAQVLSHLGSGAEIALATIGAALPGGLPPDQEFSQSVWARWDAMSPREQADGFLNRDGELLGLLAGFTAEQREELRFDLRFLPEPVPLAAAAGMRLNEAAQHSWDVRVAFDPSAAIEATTATVLAEQFSDGLGFMLGFGGKADHLAEPAVVAIDGTSFAIVITDSVSMATTEAQPTATFTGPIEAAIRMLAGRLGPSRTPSGVSVSGNVSLDDLRRVFPGY